MPFQIWVLTVERQHRIRLSEDAVTAIPWLNPKQTTNGLGFMGAFGQLQIAPEPMETAFAQQLTAALESAPADASEASAPWMDFARFAATRWPITFVCEQGRKRMTFVLPKEARDLGLVPGSGSSAVVFVSGNVVEVWKGPDWVAHLRQLRRELDAVTDNAADALAQRTA